jgi:alkyldihydroxyacetonephosphate synthase
MGMASHAPAAQASPLALELLREWRAAFPELYASASPADRLAYARDLWPRHHLTVRHRAASDLPQPALVLWPKNTHEVARIVEFARASGTAIVPYGAGSGVCGGILPSPRMVVLDMKRMASEVASP